MLGELKEYCEHHGYALYDPIDLTQSTWPAAARDPWDVLFIESRDSDRLSSLFVLSQRLLLTPLYQLTLSFLQIQLRQSGSTEICDELDLPESVPPEKELAFIEAAHPWVCDSRITTPYSRSSTIDNSKK